MILKTSARRFTTFIENRPRHEQKVEHPSGELILWVQPAHTRNTPTGTAIVERRGVHWIRNPDTNGPTWLTERLGVVIWFEVLTLNDEPDRIEVHGDCEYPDAMILFMTTLARIAETWPGAQAEVLAYLEEMSEASTTGIEWWDQQVNEAAKTIQAQLLEAEEPKPHPDASETGGAEAGGEAVGKPKESSDEAIRLVRQYTRRDIDSEKLLGELQQLGELPSLSAKLRYASLDMLAVYIDEGRRYFEEYYPKPQREFQKDLDCDKSTVERYVGAFRAVCRVAGIEPESLKDYQ